MARWAVIVGVVMLVPTALWLAAGILGLVSTQAMAVAGVSGLRVLASCAVAGCLLAAIGSWKQELEQHK